MIKKIKKKIERKPPPPPKKKKKKKLKPQNNKETKSPQKAITYPPPTLQTPETDISNAKTGFIYYQCQNKT